MFLKRRIESTNPHFPFWKTANVVIFQLASWIRPIFIDQGNGQVTFMFLRPELLKIVPEEDRAMFNERYSLWLKEVSNHIDMDELFRPFLNLTITPTKILELENATKYYLRTHYTHKFNHTIEDLFLGYMGIAPYTELCSTVNN